MWLAACYETLDDSLQPARRHGISVPAGDGDHIHVATDDLRIYCVLAEGVRW